MNKKIIIVSILVIAIIVIGFVYLIIFQSIESYQIGKNNQQTVFEVVELKLQKDFALVGESIYTGSGFEPGFSLKINLAGQKFGTELISKYGETRYVGYLDLINPSTSTKIFSGKMLDINDNVVDGEFKIYEKVCGMPSGENTTYTVDIKVASETLSGCVEQK